MIHKVFNIKYEVSFAVRAASFRPNSLFMAFMLVVGFTVAPVVEEIFFRGFLYTALRSKMHIAFAAIIQACVFSAMHIMGIMGSLDIFLTGI